MIPVDPLQGPAVVLGMAGAALVASPPQGIRRAGFGARVVGNLLWVIYATVEGNAYDDSLWVLPGHGGTGADEHAGRGGCGPVHAAGLNDMDRCPHDVWRGTPSHHQCGMEGAAVNSVACPKRSIASGVRNESGSVP